MDRTQGMNWIRKEKRLAIYMRDGFSCAYCGDSVEDGIILTLDHIKPISKEGSNKETNLVTACRSCNSKRQDRPIKQWCKIVAEYINNGDKHEEILRHVRNCSRRVISVKKAREIMRLRKRWNLCLTK